jgi:uncharacterized protein (TIGR02246 family)
MIRAPFLAVTPLVLLAACGSAADPDALLETIRATEQSQVEAIAAKDLRGAVRNYQDDAVMISPGEPPAKGAAAISAAFEDLLADPNLKIEITPGPAWAAASGDLAVTTATGVYTSTEPGTDEPVELTVSNQTVWRKTEGSPWKIVSDYNLAQPSEQ